MTATPPALSAGAESAWALLVLMLALGQVFVVVALGLALLLFPIFGGPSIAAPTTALRRRPQPRRPEATSWRQ